MTLYIKVHGHTVRLAFSMKGNVNATLYNDVLDKSGLPTASHSHCVII